MNLTQIGLIGLSLSMDAFAVSICKGLSLKNISLKICLFIAGIFALFQGAMPLLGYYLGLSLSNFIVSIDDYVAFILLAIVGISMIKESYEQREVSSSVEILDILVLAIATSIDALAVGITFSFLECNIWISIVIIMLITFILCFIGVRIGNVFEDKYQNIAIRMGGVVLLILAFKVLIEHIFF